MTGPRQLRGKAPKVKQACDACHSRKIRCDGIQPCLNCTASDSICTYLAVPKKTGPKGPRRSARARKDLPPSLKPSLEVPQNPSPAVSLSDEPRFSPEQDSAPEDGFSHGAAGPQPCTIIPSDVILLGLDAFFKHKYPITPILDRDQIEACLPNLDTSSEVYGLLTACCSVMVLTPELIESSPSSSPATEDSHESRARPTLPTVDALLSETMRARLSCDWVEHPSLTSVQTSFFLFSAYFCLGKDNSAWFYLREAITTLQTLRYHEESTYDDLSDDPTLAKYARRMFWVLFITERAYALQRHRPLTIQKTIELPIAESALEENIISGFLDLIFLFQNFDNDFLNIWNLQAVGSTTSPESLVRLQNILQFSLQNISSCTESQKADLLLTRQWLKTMVWQLCVTRALLSSSTDEESMSLAYPITIARDTIVASNILSPTALEANGVGIVEKVFDIGCSLADVLSLQPRLACPVALEIGAMDYLLELVRISSTVVGGSSRHLQFLVGKVNNCLEIRAGQGMQGITQVWELDEEADEISQPNAEQSITSDGIEEWGSTEDAMSQILWAPTGKTENSDEDMSVSRFMIA